MQDVALTSLTLTFIHRYFAVRAVIDGTN